MSATLVTIPLDRLVPSKANMRKTDKRADIGSLAASIAANGLLENLVVSPANGGSEYEVVAGGRRLAALKQLAKEKKLEPSHPVACLVAPDNAALAEISLAENFARVPPHPADQFEAFAKLYRAGQTAEVIASRFGVTETFVQQRLKLARVSAKLLAEYRKGAMTLEQLTAFTLSDDRNLQEQVWFDNSYGDLSAQAIRRRLTQTRVDASDRRARFVGPKAYEEAGGVIVRDLFDAAHEGYLEDSQLLDRLVKDKLGLAAQDLRKEGWLWVAEVSQIDPVQLCRFDRASPGEVALSKSDEKRLNKLCERYDELVSVLEESGEETTSAELDRIERQMADLNLRKELWPDDVKAVSGAVVSLDDDGSLAIIKGLIRRADNSDGDVVAQEDGRIRQKPARGGYPDSVLADLAAHRTAALREAVAGNPAVALTTLLHALVSQIFRGSNDGCLEIRMTQAVLVPHSQSVGNSNAMEAVLQRHTSWAARIPEQEALWEWLGALDEAERHALLAYCIGSAINDLHHRSDDTRHLHAIAVARDVDLDMTSWWNPTEAFFARLTKADILAAVREGASEKAASRLADSKKGDMAKKTEQLLATSGWLPAALRFVPASESENTGSEEDSDIRQTA